MLVLNPDKPKPKCRGTRGRGRDRLTAKQEAFSRLVALRGLPQREAYIAAHRTDGMKPASISAEASRMAAHKGIALRIEALRNELVQVDLHDRRETQSFILNGLKELALRADTSASQVRAFELLGKVHFVSLFTAPTGDDSADRRSAEEVKASLEQRLNRLLPPPDE